MNTFTADQVAIACADAGLTDAQCESLLCALHYTPAQGEALSQEVGDEMEALNYHWPEIHAAGMDHGWRGVAEAAWKVRAALAQRVASQPVAIVSQVNEANHTAVIEVSTSNGWNIDVKVGDLLCIAAANPQADGKEG